MLRMRQSLFISSAAAFFKLHTVRMRDVQASKAMLMLADNAKRLGP